MTTAARRPAVGFILVTVLIDMIGFGLAFPVLPLLVGDFTPDRAQQSIWTGVLAGAYGLMQWLAAPLLGALSDRVGRRPVLVVAILGLGAHHLLMALAPSLWFMLAARLIGGAAGATFSVAGAYVSDITAPADRAKAFGMLGATFGLGFILGPVIGGLLGDLDPRMPFIVAAGASLVNACYGALVVPESLAPEHRAPFSFARANPFGALHALVAQRATGPLVRVFVLYSLAHAMMVETWVLYTRFRFGWGPRENGISLFIVGVVATIVGAWGLGKMIAAWGDVRVALLALASGVVAYLGYALSVTPWMIYAVTILVFPLHATTPALKGIVSRTTPPDAQGVTMGALDGIYALMAVIGPLLGTNLLALVSDAPAASPQLGIVFFTCAALQAAAFKLARRHLAAVPIADVSAASA
ncbi:MAG: MFS transporter [Gemmatimonadaceae bacterium]|jgi:DHA1 family tetracycline resistance protein-like MFS transporter|nr:MFS transporter [Gemmatimonadaceae bacterium]